MCHQRFLVQTLAAAAMASSAHHHRASATWPAHFSTLAIRKISHLLFFVPFQTLQPVSEASILPLNSVSALSLRRPFLCGCLSAPTANSSAYLVPEDKICILPAICFSLTLTKLAQHRRTKGLKTLRLTEKPLDKKADVTANTCGKLWSAQDINPTVTHHFEAAEELRRRWTSQPQRLPYKPPDLMCHVGTLCTRLGTPVSFNCSDERTIRILERLGCLRLFHHLDHSYPTGTSVQIRF